MVKNIYYYHFMIIINIGVTNHKIRSVILENNISKVFKKLTVYLQLRINTVL